MQVVFYPGWPLKYAHVLVEGMRGEHVGNGLVCLWAEDDPAQVSGRHLDALFERIDAWADAAGAGFALQDRALDAFMSFEARSAATAELPFADLLAPGGNGYIAGLVAAELHPNHFDIQVEGHDFGDRPLLRGAFYLRSHLVEVPRTLEEVLACLTNRQRDELTRGLESRSDVNFGEPSGGLDFVVVSWPRHESEHDALVLMFSGVATQLQSQAIRTTPSDSGSRAKRAGQDAPTIKASRVLIAGAGSIGGYVAMSLAESGLDALFLCDSETLTTGNVVRHVCGDDQVGMPKTAAVAQIISRHAPWTRVVEAPDLSLDPDQLAVIVADFDLVIDCTGNFAVSAALAHTCKEADVALITVALFHQGRLARLQRQAAGDIAIAARNADERFVPLPPSAPDEFADPFLELGCTAPINNAPPAAALAAAADASSAALDFLAGRMQRAQERYIVFQGMEAPFDRPTTIDYPRENQ